MKALVTGGAGFIGRWVVKRLLADGHDVVALDDLSTGRRENLAGLADDRGFRFTHGDLADRGTLAAVFARGPFDLVLHLGASIQVQRSIDDPATTFRNDVAGTFAVLEACQRQYLTLNGLEPGRAFDLQAVAERLRDRRPRVLAMSTCMVYAPATGDVGIGEAHPLRPASPYAACKIAAESLALSYFHAYRLPVSVVRPFNTYGPFQRADSEGGVVAIFLKRRIAGEPLLVKGDGTQTRDFLYVEDCAEFVVRAALAPAAEGEILNGGTGHEVSIAALAALVAGDAGRIQHVPHDHPQSEVRRLRCDPRNTRRLLGWEPATPLRDGLARTRVWLEENRWAW